ncbi:hypothetical protein KR059_011534 [Drosophila kikkawai]|nr:hypothetical protein KR059_011534 [Drosophila kikkawai]
MDELSEEDKLTVARARKMQRFLSQPFQVAEVFTGHPGKLVPVEKTVEGFKRLLNGEYDDIPEIAFYMVGDAEEVLAKATQLASSMQPDAAAKAPKGKDGEAKKDDKKKEGKEEPPKGEAKGDDKMEEKGEAKEKDKKDDKDKPKED